jgi:hypothetical protein
MNHSYRLYLLLFHEEELLEKLVNFVRGDTRVKIKSVTSQKQSKCTRWSQSNPLPGKFLGCVVQLFSLATLYVKKVTVSNATQHFAALALGIMGPFKGMDLTLTLMHCIKFAATVVILLQSNHLGLAML